MEPDGSLLHSQVPATCPYPEPAQSSPYLNSTLPEDHLNILPSVPGGLPSGLFPSGFPTKTLYKLLLYPVHATCPIHLILLDFITQRILGEEYRSLNSTLSFSLLPCYLIPLRPKYSPQRPILQNPQPTFPPQYE